MACSAPVRPRLPAMSAATTLEKGFGTTRSVVNVKGWALAVLTFQSLGRSHSMTTCAVILMLPRDHLLRHWDVSPIRLKRYMASGRASTLQRGCYRWYKRHRLVSDSPATAQICGYLHLLGSLLTASSGSLIFRYSSVSTLAPQRVSRNLV